MTTTAKHAENIFLLAKAPHLKVGCVFVSVDITKSKGGINMKNQPKHPCINCIYFKACGDTTRTMPCNGRMTKSEKKKELKK